MELSEAFRNILCPNELEALMQNLASGKLQRVLLSHIADAHWVPPLEEVVLTVSEKDSNVSNEHRGERLVCKWTESAEGWLESAEKIAATIRVPCFPLVRAYNRTDECSAHSFQVTRCLRVPIAIASPYRETSSAQSD